VIVGAINYLLAQAVELKKLRDRIDKPYRYFEPAKGDDSQKFPKIDLVTVSTQRLNANYFGRYIEECIKAIPGEHVAAAKEKHEPVALIIGSEPYKSQVERHLVEAGLASTRKKSEVNPLHAAYEILLEDAQSNLGWRIILSLDEQKLAKKKVREAAEKQLRLVDAISNEERNAVLAAAKAWAASAPDEDDEAEEIEPVKMVSFEGSKGMSAQYVFLIGIHSGEIPRAATAIKDMEICKFLVGLTRTKKKCSILVTRMFGGDFKQPSEFLSWIKAERFHTKKVDAAYWKNK
jgi:superfamily I DNA/RNA helicase